MIRNVNTKSQYKMNNKIGGKQLAKTRVERK